MWPVPQLSKTKWSHPVYHITEQIGICIDRDFELYWKGKIILNSFCFRIHKCVIDFRSIFIKMVAFSTRKVKLQLSVKLTYMYRSFPINVRLIECSDYCYHPCSPLPPLALVSHQNMLQWWIDLLRKFPFRKGKFYFKISEVHPSPILGDHSNIYISLWSQRNFQAQPSNWYCCICL